jgi:polyisoprenoid-binding protein YceI
MNIRNILLALAVFAIPAVAADYHVDLKPENAKIRWALSDVLHTVNGTFSMKRGAIDFDPETGKASGQVVVDVPSGNSGSEARDHRMHANVLESAKYPDATFTPDRIEGMLSVPGTSDVRIHGVFTIHGASHEVTMATHATTTPDQLQATLSFDIPYVAWGMKDPSNILLKVNKIVPMSIEITAPLQKH